MPERTIVAVDGGAGSDAALAWVIDRAKHVDMHLEITAVVHMGADVPAGLESYYRSGFEDVLLRAEATVAAAVPDLYVVTRIRRGSPHEELALASRDADLLVIGSTRASTVAGIVHGTLPLKIAGRSACAIVVVPAGWLPHSGDVVVGWAPDETSDAALGFAAREAARRRERLTLVHTWSYPLFDGIDAPALAVEELVAAHQRLLSDAAGRIRQSDPEQKVAEVIQSGSAAVAIVRAAADASLVVVGSRGRGPVADFFLGSVSHDVLLNLPAPVAVIPRARNGSSS
jgi:nucleotide-binding universal stress UspA family protein